MAAPDSLYDRFEITAELAGGAMSRVFLGRDRVHNDLVAIKLIDVQRPEARARFDREVNVLLRLAPLPTSVRYRTHGAWTHNEGAIVTEWIVGENLAERLARGSLTIEQCARLGASAATAIADIHAFGVVHGDIKPANLLLVEASLSDVRVVDFGLACMGTVEHCAAASLGPVGTPAYMAPERVRADSGVGPASDLYSLGAVLFECLTGRAPVSARNAVSAMAETLRESLPRVSELRLSVPAALDALVAALLARNPSDRPRSAIEVRDVLRAIELRARPRAAYATVEQLTALRDRAHDALRRCALSDAMAHASEALAMDPPRELRAQLLTLKSEARMHCGEVSLAADRAEQALGSLQPGETWWFLAARVAITARGQMGQNDRVLELVARLGRERPLEDVSGALAAQLECVCAAGTAVPHHDSSEELDTLLADLEARAQGFNQEAPALRARLHLLHAARHEAADDLVSAVMGAKSSLAVAVQAGLGIEALVARVHLGRLLMLRGDRARAEAQLTVAHEHAHTVGARLWEAVSDAMLAALDAGDGDPAAILRAERAQGACEVRGAIGMASITHEMVIEIERKLRSHSLHPTSMAPAVGDGSGVN